MLLTVGRDVSLFIHDVSRAGRLHRRPLKRAKSRSSVIHSQPDSIANAAKYASGIKLPKVSASRYSCVNISQCRGPGLTGIHWGWPLITLTNVNASSGGLGRMKTRGWVTMRRNPLNTRSETANASSPPSTASSHGLQDPCSGVSSRYAATRTFTSGRTMIPFDEIKQRGRIAQGHTGHKSCPMVQRQI